MLSELNTLAGKAAKVDNILAWREAVDAVGKNLTSFSSWMNQYIPKDSTDEAAQIDRVTQDGRKGELISSSHLAQIKELTGKIDETKKQLESANNAMRPQAEELPHVRGRNELRHRLQAASEDATAGAAANQGQPGERIQRGGPRVVERYRQIDLQKNLRGRLHCHVPGPRRVFAGEYYFSRKVPRTKPPVCSDFPLLSRGNVQQPAGTAKRPASSLSPKCRGQRGRLRSALGARIQQSLRRPGAVIVFSPLEHEESPISLICKLAVCFAEREELVLVARAAGQPRRQRLGPACAFSTASAPHSRGYSARSDARR